MLTTIIISVTPLISSTTMDNNSLLHPQEHLLHRAQQALVMILGMVPLIFGLINI